MKGALGKQVTTRRIPALKSRKRKVRVRKTRALARRKGPGANGMAMKNLGKSVLLLMLMGSGRG